eukprot:4789081-Pleurochrysis_carterae.AAC.6
MELVFCTYVAAYTLPCNVAIHLRDRSPNSSPHSIAMSRFDKQSCASRASAYGGCNAYGGSKQAAASCVAERCRLVGRCMPHQMWAHAGAASIECFARHSRWFYPRLEVALEKERTGICLLTSLPHVFLRAAGSLQNKQAEARRPPPRMSVSTVFLSSAHILSQKLLACTDTGLSRAAAVACGVGLLVRYHVVLLRGEERNLTWRSVLAETRRQWAEHVRRTQGYLYAVQTLRNAITANTFWASTMLSLFTL